ncbi:hypothetical protein SAMD00079811_36760 [Scytonema sp. HK-05]|uniref:HEAT repeat domain-containing protein n=1 Tax=Scytonema sp. HK-05 TaxID=1137095 RepID=UPI000937CC00|nr:HEAT repeat domain-containing protein [Scytonema sp. HK-05]OKH60659.1 hypothetical protein NIES2130_02830 [Scytonema sp. HK-05]BAY46069.1 hypothetical protein SAMD00079811_36760 [Scytonema sp. HK-05]
MAIPDELKVIIEKLAAGIATDEEIEAVRQACKGSERISSQLGKYVINIEQGQGIQIGDRIYIELNSEAPQAPIQLPTLSPEALREAVRQFLEDIENTFKSIHLFHTPQPITLEDQYIPIQVSLERRYRHEVESTWSYAESEADLKRAYALKSGDNESPQEQVNWKTAKAQHKNIIVLADPGMGKSTLLRLEALSTAQQARQEIENGQELDVVVFPLYLRLSDLADSPKEEEILESVSRLIQLDYPKIAPNILLLLREKLKVGQCLLLLDALDEVPQEKRISLSQKLNRFAQNYPCPIVSTSRIVGYYSGAFVDGVKEVEIVPFSHRQTEQYVETWFRNAARYLNNNTVLASELIRELRNKPQIRGLAQNPLLLSLICSLYQEKGLTLPTRRWQVYEKAVEYILSRWCIDNRRQIPDSAWVSVKQELLGELAYQFSCERKEIFTMYDLRSKLEKYLGNESISTDFRSIRTSDLIAELSEKDGILQKLSRDRKQYLFLHRTFQEYLTACYLKHSIETDLSRGVSLVRKYFRKYEWHETLSLLAGLLDDPIPLLQAITTEKDDIFYSLLLLAGQCIAECEDKSHPLIQEIIERIYKLWYSRPSIGFFSLAVERLACTNSTMLEKLLRQALKDGSKEVRCGAVKILGNIATSQVTEHLITTIKDDDVSVRFWSALYLGSITEEKAITESLRQALKENNANVIKVIFLVLSKNKNDQFLIKVITSLMIPVDDYIIENFIIGKIFDYIKKSVIIFEYHKFHLNNFQRINTFCFVNFLLECFKFLHGSFIKEAITLLGDLDDLNALAGLTRVLQPLDKDIRRWVTQALATIKDSQFIQVQIQDTYDYDYDDESELSKKLAKELAKIDSQEVTEKVIQKLYIRCSEVRKKAAIALGKLGNSQAVDILSHTLNDSDSEVRREAAIALIKIDNLQAVETLRQVVNNSDSKVRREATIALGATDIPQAIELLTQLLNDQDGDIRLCATTALGEIGSSHAVEILIRTLGHPDGDVRREAAAALGEIGSPEAVDALINALKHEGNNEDRRWIAAALGKIKWAAKDLKNHRNTQIVESLIHTLNDSDSYVRRWIAVTLGKIRHSKAVEPLIGALSDQDISVRKHVAIALGRICDPKAVVALVNVIKDRDNEVREQAILALARIGDPRATKALISALSSPDNNFRMGAAAVLGKMQWGIYVIVQTFNKIRIPRILPVFPSLTSPSRNFQVLPPITLRKTEDVQVFSAIIRALDPPDSCVRCRAATALGEIGDYEAVKSLVRALVDPNSDVRGRAAAALGKIGSPQAIKALIQALSHPDRGVQKEAVAALKELGTSKVLKSITHSPKIDLYDPDVYTLARILAIKASMSEQKDKFFPVYPTKVQ